MIPQTLDSAIALFQGTTPLASLYGLAHEPGAQQRALVLRTLHAINGDAPESLFPGAAGTGKTTTLLLLLAVLDACDVSFLVLAPTHKAAGRAAESLGERWEVSTHHRLWCGSVEESIEEGEEFSTELRLGVADDRRVSERVLIIDEASMVSEQDLVNIRTVAPSATIVAVGDHHQLPPVGGRPGFDWSDADAIGLTKVFRQAEGSAVLTAATAIREQRVPFTYSRVRDAQRRLIFKAGMDILRAADVPSRWLTAAATGHKLAALLIEWEGDAAAVVGTHNSRVLVNDATRTCLGFPSRREGPAVGERLVARATAGGLANATTCTVERVRRQDFGDRFGLGWLLTVRTEAGHTRIVALLEQQWLLVDSPSNRGKIPHSIKRMLKVYSADDMAAHGKEITGRIQTDVKLWQVRTFRPAFDAAKALDTEARRDGDNSGTHQAAFHAASEHEPPAWLLRSMRAEAAGLEGAWGIYLSMHLAALDSGYAVTCHAAQGSQWSSVMVVSDWVDFLAQVEDEEGNTVVDGEAVYRWSYTALTRASQEARVVCKESGGWSPPSKDTGVSIGTASRDWQARRQSR